MTGGTSSLVKRISRMSRTKYLGWKTRTHNWLVAPMTLMMSSPFTRLATMAPRSSKKSRGKLCSIPSAPTNVTVLHFSGRYRPRLLSAFGSHRGCHAFHSFLFHITPLL